MSDLDGGVKVFFQLAGNLTYYEILDGGSLNKDPYQYDQSDQYQQNRAGYFPECFQVSKLGCKFRQSGWHPDKY